MSFSGKNGFLTHNNNSHIGCLDSLNCSTKTIPFLIATVAKARLIKQFKFTRKHLLKRSKRCYGMLLLPIKHPSSHLIMGSIGKGTDKSYSLNVIPEREQIHIVLKQNHRLLSGFLSCI